MNVFEKLANVQYELHAPKGQRNDFGKYNYRSAEDILLAVKPLLRENGLALIITDEMVEMGGFNYVKATARIIDIADGADITTTAFAKEELQKKGMDASQITGSCSSYARKYALNGLFAIDNTKDSDATNDGKQELASAEQIAELRELGVNEANLCRRLHVSSLEELTYDNADWAIKAKRGD